MTTRTRRTTPLGELVLAAFDEAAHHSADPDEVTQLATEAVADVLRRATRLPRRPRLVVHAPPPAADVNDAEAARLDAALQATQRREERAPTQALQLFPGVLHLVHHAPAPPGTSPAGTASFSRPLAAAVPPGLEAQPVWGFQEQDGRFRYAFHHVYGPVQKEDARGEILELDQQRSFWSASWLNVDAHGEEQPDGRWLNYAQARQRRGAGFTFAQFASIQHMRAALPHLLLPVRLLGKTR